MEVLYEVYMYMEQVEILNFDELGAKNFTTHQTLDMCISIGWAGKLGEQTYASTFFIFFWGLYPNYLDTSYFVFGPKF